jgi:hypothetical protein
MRQGQIGNQMARPLDLGGSVKGTFEHDQNVDVRILAGVAPCL